MLESQYQSSLTKACQRINDSRDDVCVECVGYLLEELRDPKNVAAFKKDVESSNIFIGSLIFVQVNSVPAIGLDKFSCCVFSLNTREHASCLPSMCIGLARLNSKRGTSRTRLSRNAFINLVPSRRRRIPSHRRRRLCLRVRCPVGECRVSRNRVFCHL